MRSHKAEQRGGRLQKLELKEELLLSSDRLNEVEWLDEALGRLEKHDPRKAKIVELRYFGGFSIEETTAVMRLSERTIRREWTLARLWLFRYLEGPSRTPPGA